MMGSAAYRRGGWEWYNENLPEIYDRNPFSIRDLYFKVYKSVIEYETLLEIAEDEYI